jgi:hypothetical protein
MRSTTWRQELCQSGSDVSSDFLSQCREQSGRRYILTCALSALGTTNVALPEHGQVVAAITEWQIPVGYALVISHLFHHDGELTPFACRSSVLPLLPQGPARLAAGVVLQTAGGETRFVRAVQGA